MNQPKTFAVILAGGQGTRFWPVSRKDCPKQFLDLANTGSSMIQSTAKRISALVSPEALLVVTNDEQKGVVREHLPTAKLIVEPCARNTTAAIGLAAITVAKSDPNAVMIILPADHFVERPEILLKALSRAVDVAAKESVLVTVGIKPTSPNTAYGYIGKGEALSSGVARVRRFFEKPSQKRAEEYLAAGDYFWNSGMFIWRASVILDAIKAHAPEIHAHLMQINSLLDCSEQEYLAAVGGDSAKISSPAVSSNLAAISDVFAKIESISIDFSVLEHAKNAVMVEAEPFGWSDVGSWDSWGELISANSDGNVSVGDVLLVDSQDCIVRSDQRLLAVLGVQNLVVVEHGNACLICSRERVQDVKLIVEELKRRGRTDLI